jgi:hypothetical protein
MIRSRIGRLSAFAAMCLVAAVGCSKGSDTAEVSGTIKRGGKAPKIERLQIAFQGGTENKLVTAPVALDGKYTATGVPTGEVKIGFVYTAPATLTKAQKPRLPQPGSKTTDVEPSKEVPNPIPLPLRDPSTSKISFVVEAGKPNVFDHDLP